MKAVILTGGAGKRLRPVTYSLPKPLISIGNKTIVQGVIEQLKKHNIQDLILATGYLATLIKDHCKDGKQWGVKISYRHEKKPLGTAGPLFLLKNTLSKERRFILVNGDIITNVNFTHLIEHHVAQKNILTIVCKKFEWQCPFGVIKMSKNNVTEIAEKPVISYKISCGIYLLDSLCLKYIPKDTYFTVPDLVARLARDNHKVGVFMISHYWKGIETLEDFSEILKLFEKQDLPEIPLGENQSHDTQRVTPE